MRNSMQASLGNKSMLGSNTLAITQLFKKEKYMKVLPSYNLAWLENKLTFGFGGKSSMPAGPQSKADIAAGGFRPKGYIAPRKQVNAANPHSDAATPQGQRSAVTSKQTADRNTMRRADAAIRRRRTKPSLLNDNSYSSTLG